MAPYKETARFLRGFRNNTRGCAERASLWCRAHDNRTRMSLIRIRAKSTPKSLGSLRSGVRVKRSLCAVCLTQHRWFENAASRNNLRKSGHRVM